MAAQQPKVLGVEDIKTLVQGYVGTRVPTNSRIEFDKTEPTKTGNETVYIIEGKVKTGSDIFDKPFQRVFKMQVHGSTGKVLSMKWETQ